MPYPSSRIPTLILLVLASLSPLVFHLLYPDGYPYDINTFVEWKDCLRAYSTQPIIPCTPKTINYPTIGLYVSGGLLLALEQLGFAPDYIRLQFRTVLGAIDILNVLVMYLLLRGLQIRYAALATALFSFLPSTRLGASLWGQIDTVSQLFLTLAFLFGLRALRGIDGHDHIKGLRYFAGLSMACLLACFTKQLVAFSLPGLCALWLTVFLKLLWRPVKRKTLAIAALLPLTAWGLDQVFPTPDGYHGSGLLYVLSTGSSHGSKITVNGTNLFSLLPIPGESPATESYRLFSILGHDITGTPFSLGIIAATLLILSGTILTLRSAFVLQPLSARTTTLVILGYTAFCNLAFNVALTGIHERYLYHYGFFAYPVILALVAIHRAYWLLLSVVAAQLSAYGCFMLLFFDANISGWFAYYAHRTTVLANLMVLTLSLILSLCAATSKPSRRPLERPAK